MKIGWGVGEGKSLGKVGKKEQERHGQLVTQRSSPRQAQAPAAGSACPLPSSQDSEAGPLTPPGETPSEVHVAVPRWNQRGGLGLGTMER